MIDSKTSMSLWGLYLENLSDEDIQALDTDYRWTLEEDDIVGSEEFCEHVYHEVETYLFVSDKAEKIKRLDGEDVNDALKRPAYIFQLGIEGGSVGYASTLRGIKYWAQDFCNPLNSYLIDAFKLEFDGQLPAQEEQERLLEILYPEDFSNPPPSSLGRPF